MPVAGAENVSTYRLVMVEWVDSRQATGCWEWIHELPAPSACQVVSVGYMLREDANAIALACSLADADSDRGQASGIIQIPTCCIKCIMPLLPAGEP